MSTLRLLRGGRRAAARPRRPAAAHKRHRHHHKPKDVKVQLLAFNDFHGHLQTATTGGIRPTDPARRRRRDRPRGRRRVSWPATSASSSASNRNSLVVSAGDLIGASPLLSALYHDEPTIEAMNLLGLDLSVVGNHEFDEGADELQRMQRGGCHPDDGCQDGDGFDGADFDFLAANVVDEDNAKPLFPPYAIRRFQGEKIGFIGMTLEGTPSIVSPSGIAEPRRSSTRRRPPTATRASCGAATASRRSSCCCTRAASQSVPFNTATARHAAPGISGPILDIVKNTTDAVDLFITGHTHQPYNCVIDGRPVTSASSFGPRCSPTSTSRSGATATSRSCGANEHPDRTRTGRRRVQDVTALIDALRRAVGGRSAEPRSGGSRRTSAPADGDGPTTRARSRPAT